MRHLTAYTETGHRVGQTHPQARISDRDVDLIRQLHEDPQQPMGYRLLARKFELPKRTIRDICSYRRRAVTAIDHRSAKQPPQPYQVTPADLKRRYQARRESLIQELSQESGLHRNTIAALARQVEKPKPRKSKRRMAPDDALLLATQLG